MSPFWQGVAEVLSKCGRSAYLFVLAMLVLGLSALFWEKGGWALLSGALAMTMGWLVIQLISQFRGRGRLDTFPPLSRHDLHAARSKLLRRRNKR